MTKKEFASVGSHMEHIKSINEVQQKNHLFLFLLTSDVLKPALENPGAQRYTLGFLLSINLAYSIY